MKQPGCKYFDPDGFEVGRASFVEAKQFISDLHYTGGAANTAVYIQALKDRWGQCKGIAWWMPPAAGAVPSACLLAGNGDPSSSGTFCHFIKVWNGEREMRADETRIPREVYQNPPGRTPFTPEDLESFKRQQKLIEEVVRCRDRCP